MRTREEDVARAVARAIEARQRPVAGAAVALLREHEALLGHYGGVDGYLDIAEAAATLTWALRVVEALLVIARGGPLG